jgi:hypothetical protein
MMYPIYEFDPGLHPGRFVEADHQSSLIVEAFVFPAELGLDLKVPGNLFVIKMSIVPDKAVMRFAPEIGMGIGKNGKLTAFLFPLLGFV